MTDRDERLAEGAGVSGGEVLGGSLGEELGSDAPPVVTHPQGYLRTLLLLLLAATFFEGYDGAILGLVLPDIRDTFNVTESQLGVSRALIELGLGGAFFLARAGDRWGRRTLLLWSVLGYTVMTALTAASWDLWSFTAFQSLSRVFIGAEYAVAVTMIVEEFPKDRRARVLGLFLMCSAIGAVAVALFLIGGVADGPLEWRTLYLIGLIPLVFLAVFRRGVKETQRFQDHAAAVRSGGGELRVNFWEPWRPEYRRTLVLVGLIHLFRSLPLFGATAWFFYYAEREVGMDQNLLYVIFIAAYGFGTLGYWVCGNLMDRIGRRPTAILYGVLAAFSSVGLFQARSAAAVGILMVLAVFFGLGMAPVTGAISTELFPTYIRNQSAAWARNVFEIAGFILGPLLVGVLGDHYTGALGSIGDAVSILVLLFVPATFLIWRHLPETKGRELEEIEHELGISGVRDAGTGPERRHRRRAWAFAGVIAVAIGLPIGLGVVALGSFTERPEGAAERFLQGVDSGELEALARYGSPDVAEELFGTTSAELSHIEIGAAVPVAHLRVVPFRVVLEHTDRTVSMSLTTERVGSDWKVTGFAPRGPVTQLRVPSEGGPAPAGAPVAAWIVALGSVAAVTVIAEIVLRALRSSVPSAG
ncbi:MAG: MFS transporter [Actinomycetota bacterium]